MSCASSQPLLGGGKQNRQWPFGSSPTMRTKDSLIYPRMCCGGPSLSQRHWLERANLFHTQTLESLLIKHSFWLTMLASEEISPPLWFWTSIIWDIYLPPSLQPGEEESWSAPPTSADPFLITFWQQLCTTLQLRDFQSQPKKLLLCISGEGK